MLRGIIGVERAIGGRDHQTPAIGHRIAGIGGQIGQARFELGRVDDDRPQLRREVERDLDILADGSAQQPSDPGDQLVDVDVLRPERLLPGEGEQAARQVGPTKRRVERLVRQLVDIGIILFQIAQQIDIANDHAEHVVEIMRHAACQIADGLHLLSLMELRLQLGPLDLLAVLNGEVAQDAGKMPVSAGPPFGDRQMRRKNRPVLAADFEFPDRPQIARRMALGLLPHRRRQQHPHVLADQFRRPIAGHGFGRPAEFLNNSVLVADDDRVDRRLEDRPIAALALPELPFDSRASAALVPQPDNEKPGQKAEHQPGNGTRQTEGVQYFGSETRHRDRPDFSNFAALPDHLVNAFLTCRPERQKVVRKLDKSRIRKDLSLKIALTFYELVRSDRCRLYLNLCFTCLDCDPPINKKRLSADP